MLANAHRFASGRLGCVTGCFPRAYVLCGCVQGVGVLFYFFVLLFCCCFVVVAFFFYIFSFFVLFFFSFVRYVLTVRVV